MAIKIAGNASGYIAEVNSNNELLVALTQTESNAGFAAITSENDAGDYVGVRYMLSPETSSDYRLRTAIDTTFFNQVFPGAAINSAVWTAPVTTMTLTASGGFANLNAGLSTASGAVARLTSYRSFPVYMSYPTYCEMDVQFTQGALAQNVCEWGFIICTGTSAPTDGVFFRYNASGEFRCVVNNNGTEVQSASLPYAELVGTNVTKHFLISVLDTEAVFWIDNVKVASVPLPNATGALTSSQSMPMTFRNYNAAVTSAAQVMKVGNVNVSLGDMANNKLWSQIICGGGGMAYQGQTGGTMGTTALYTNSLAAGAGAAMTNTTAALGSGLGGQFTAQPTLAAGTDGIVCSYQVPAGTAALPATTLYITGIKISAMVTAALTGGAVLYAYSAAFGHTSVSLATTESATSKAPRRVALGNQVFAANAAVGVTAQDVYMSFNSPIVVNAGEFFAIAAKNLGTVTSAGTITFLVTIDGYFE